MRNTIRSQELKATIESIHQKNPGGCLVIDSEFDTYLNQSDFTYLLPDVISGEASNEMVINDTVSALREGINFAKRDALNIRRCAAFIRNKFPQAIFTCYNFSIGVENLTPDEIKLCLEQDGLKFTYYTE